MDLKLLDDIFLRVIMILQMNNLRLKSNRCLAAILFFLVLAITPLRAADGQPNYLTAGEPPATNLLMPPPLPGSDEQKFDLAEVAAVQHASSSNELAAALLEDKGVSLDYFTPVIGDALESGKLPLTKAFLKRVHEDAGGTVNVAKNYYQRPRPCTVDPSLLMGKSVKSFSYPSGHSTESMTLALVLAELFPDQRDALVAEARTIGWHRVEIARHYPTDIFAGRVLAQAIVREMEKNPDFKKDFAAAKAEIAAAQK
jgi:acid phosphatase (class A)